MGLPENLNTMGYKRWDAQRWHRTGPRRYHSTWTPSARPRAVVAGALLAILALAGGAVGMAHVAPTQPDKVGICHATGSSERPFVFLVVDRAGADHGHHEAHEQDLIDVASEAACGAIETPDEAAPTTTCGPVVEQTAVPAGAEPEAPAAAPAEDVPTATEADAAATDANTTPPEAAPAAQEPSLDCTADVSATATGLLLPQHVWIEYVLVSAGPEEADEVLLNASLPDVGRAWTMAGPDASDCVLEERSILCDFDDLRPGESRRVNATAARCPEDCGEDFVADAVAQAYNDRDATNNLASLLIPVPDCGEAVEPVPEPSPAPSEPPANATSPPANETPPEPPGPDNGTQNGTPEPAPAPAVADLRLLQKATQDDEQVVIVLRVENAGPGVARNVTLADALPEVRRAWFVGGPDASSCVLEGRSLTCWFGALDPGANRTVELRAYTDRLPCGEHKVNTAWVAAGNEESPSDNRSSASILARPC